MTLPGTQLDAFHLITEKEAKQMVVLATINFHGGATLFELVKYLGWPVNRISGRVSEIKKQGLIFDSGRSRINPDSGMKGIVWSPTNRRVK